MIAWGVSGALAAALAALLALAPLAGGEPQASLPDIEDEVMCPICGTTLDKSSSPQAERERALIRSLIEQGRNKEEIKDALVAEYGEDVLATPQSSGFDAIAWIVPLAALVLGATFVGLRLAGRQRPEEKEARPLDAAEAERLDLDLDLTREDS